LFQTIRVETVVLSAIKQLSDTFAAMNFKAIIFDLGGVLVDWNPDYLFNKVFDDADKRSISLKTFAHRIGTKSRMPAAR
jgi:uncharacterized membrane protein